MAHTRPMLASLSEVMNYMEHAHLWNISDAKRAGKMRDGPRRRKGRDSGLLNRHVDVLPPFSMRDCDKDLG